MKSAWALGIGAALAVHGGVLLFGGIFFLHGEADHHAAQVVDVVTDLDKPAEKEKEKPAEQPKEESEELKADKDPPPDAKELMKNLQLSAAEAAPALDAASLGAIEMALNGHGGGGDFANALSFDSGGRIDGLGKRGLLGDKLDVAFSLAEIDQKPRAIFQAAPLYPSAMRGKKVEGVVTVIFVVDATGKVGKARVVSSTAPAFEKPALDAVRQWRFEAAVKGGQRVSCEMRVPIRFQPS